MRTFFYAPLRRSRIVARHPRAEFYPQDRKPGLETRALAVDFVSDAHCSRQISRDNVSKLARYFSVDPGVFLPEV